MPLDVADDDSVSAVAADVAHEGTIDVLINNAGVHGPAGDPTTLTGTDLLAVLDVNVAGVVRTTTRSCHCCAGPPTPSSSTSAAR